MTRENLQQDSVPFHTQESRNNGDRMNGGSSPVFVDGIEPLTWGNAGAGSKSTGYSMKRQKKEDGDKEEVEKERGEEHRGQ